MIEPGNREKTDHSVRLSGLPALAAAAGAGIGTVSMASEPILRDGVPALSIAGGAAYIAIHILLAAAWLIPLALGTAVNRPLTGRIPAAGEILTGLAFGIFSYFVGVDAVSGTWASSQSWAPVAPFAVAVCAGGAAMVAVAAITRLRHWALPLLTTGAALGCVAIDILTFPGSYLFLHLGVRVAAVGFAVATFASAAALTTIRPPLWFQLIGCVVVVAAVVIWFAGPHSATKSMLLRRGPAATLATHLGTSTADSFGNPKLVSAASPDQSPALPPAPRGEATVDNVVVFYVDTLRFDAIPPNRPDAGTRFAKSEDTPFLNDFLPQCHTFRRVYAPSSATHKSIPSTFRSQESWSIEGYPLGLVLDERGIKPAATVLNYFDHTKHTRSTQLLDGFENVRIYDSVRQSDVLLKSNAMFDDISDERFFAWIHFFAVHRPGWDGELISTTVDPPIRYRRSLAWLDQTLGRLVAEVERRGLADSTAIVLASDHGEGIGDHDVGTHGPTVFDSEIRVPLAICLPDRNGEVWETTVGNIDLIPTLLDLLGTEPDPTHVGHSFARSIVDGEPRAERSYYFENWSATRRGVWFRDKKLMFAPRQSLFFLYDHTLDAEELEDRFEEAKHADYMRLLFEHNPTLMGDATNSKDLQLGVITRLEEVDPANPPPDVDYLLQLGGLIGTGPIENQVMRIFRATPHPALRAMIFDAFASSAFTGELLAELNERGEVTPQLVKAAARHKISLKRFSKMETFIMELDARTSPELRTAWLELANHVQKRGPEWERWLLSRLNALANAPASVSDMQRHYLAANVATTSWSDPNRAGEVLTSRFLNDPDVNVQRTTIRTISSIGHARAVPALLRVAASEKRDHVVRREAVRAVGELGEAGHGRLLMEAVKGDRFLSKHGAFALAKLGDTESAEKLIRRHPRIADDARKALKEASEDD